MVVTSFVSICQVYSPNAVWCETADRFPLLCWECLKVFSQGSQDDGHSGDTLLTINNQIRLPRSIRTLVAFNIDNGTSEMIVLSFAETSADDVAE